MKKLMKENLRESLSILSVIIGIFMMLFGNTCWDMTNSDENVISKTCWLVRVYENEYRDEDEVTIIHRGIIEFENGDTYDIYLGDYDLSEDVGKQLRVYGIEGEDDWHYRKVWAENADNPLSGIFSFIVDLGAILMFVGATSLLYSLGIILLVKALNFTVTIREERMKRKMKK